ncbi:aldose 1-epimerase [Mesorhizobium sp. IMUNJ 23232]|uniref:aldose 1-epimerase n=1 Tax=Mesorhizobium sp. IMUNJ 23232 TaxID=3376064 RepID=UPI0037B08494
MFHLESGSLVANIDARGGSVMRFARTAAGGEVPLFHRGRAGRGQPLCFPLVPFGNRLRDNTFVFDGTLYNISANTATDPLYLHGDGWLGSWTELAHSQDTVSLEYRHDAGGPYQYRAEQRFTLTERALTVSLSVTNQGERTLPYGLGLHPFFPLTNRTVLTFAAERYWLQDAAFLPLRSEAVHDTMDFSRGRSPSGRWMNTEFEGWTGRAKIFWPETSSHLVIEADPIFSRCMVFVSSRKFDPTYEDDYFCFEPMTHGVDGHHRPGLSGLVPLQPGETMQGSCRFTIA